MKVIQEAFQWAGAEKHFSGEGSNWGLTSSHLHFWPDKDQPVKSAKSHYANSEKKNTASRNLWAFQLMITPWHWLSTAQHCACMYSQLWFLLSVMHSYCHGQYLGSQLHPAKDIYYLFPLFLAPHWPVQHNHLHLVADIMWNFVYCDALHGGNQCYYSGYCFQEHCYS